MVARDSFSDSHKLNDSHENDAIDREEALRSRLLVECR